MTKKSKHVVRVGLLGLGNVGGGVAEILARHGSLIAGRTGIELRLVRALVRNPRRQRPGSSRNIELVARPERVLEADDVDVVAEVAGGLEPARTWVLSALERGKPVVTANKAIVAKHGAELDAAARRGGVRLYFEAAVGGGVPIIRTLREGLASDRIVGVMGILNGTTNFILSEMESGAAYADAVAEAQRRGFAEADPTTDVSGRDAADKLAILLRLGFGPGVDPEAITTVGITTLVPEVLADAAELGYRVKLLASGRHAEGAPSHHVAARVHPTLVPLGHPLSTVSAAQNALLVESDALGSTLYQGPGAGGLPTGSAVLADLLDAARDHEAGLGPVETGPGKKLRLISSKEVRDPYYLRLVVRDQPGVLAAITRVLARHDISLATVLQRERGTGKSSLVPVLLTTHEASMQAMNRAVDALRRLPVVSGPVHRLPILSVPR